jgi:glucan endo-1,3-alpha-glucosidase
MRLSLVHLLQAVVIGVAGVCSALVQPETCHRQSENKSVFAHFIVGIVASYTQDDWTNDMTLAQSMGIDGFALDIGKDSYNDQQLGFAYAAAEAINFKVFISFDFNYWTSADVSTIAGYINTYGTKAAQFLYNDKIFVSSFIGDGFDWRSVESQSEPLFACPNWQAASLDSNNADCGFNWNAWSSQNNQPIDSNKTTADDQTYISALGSKPYMMPVSPWFFTHYGTDTYNKNWIFYSDWLWNARWDQALQLAPQFVEIITWNDFGESHYIGPLHPNDEDVYAGGPTGAQKWVPGFTHDAWRDVAIPYIKAFKSGASSPVVTEDELVYYYRPNPKDADCSDAVAKPTGYQYDDDLVFVTAMLKSPGTVVIQSGSNTVSIDVGAGIHTVSGPMGVGQQIFTLKRGSSTIMSGTSTMDISNSCTVNNFNAYVASVKA